MRESCRHVIRRCVKDNYGDKSLIEPISDMEIWPIMKRFLLFKDLPRTQKGIEKMEKFHPKLKLLHYEEDEEDEEEDEDVERYAQEMLDELL